MKLQLSRKQGWLLPCLVFQILALGFLIAGLATTSWIHFDCNQLEYEMGVFQVCNKVVNSSQAWNCTMILLGMETYELPHWLFSTQVLSFTGLAFAGITLLLTVLLLISKMEGNIALGIAGLCISSGALTIMNLMSLTGHIDPTHDTSFLDTITTHTPRAINTTNTHTLTTLNTTTTHTVTAPGNNYCPDKHLTTSYSILLLGISTISNILAGIWALLGSLFVTAGIGNITTNTGYRSVLIDFSEYNFYNNGFYDSSSSSEGDDSRSVGGRSSRRSSRGSGGSEKRVKRKRGQTLKRHDSSHSNC